MASSISPDRPPGALDTTQVPVDSDRELCRGAAMDSQSNHFSRSLENSLPLHQDKEDKGRGGRKTRWDPSPTKQGALSDDGLYDDLDESSRFNSNSGRRVSVISSSSSGYGNNGYPDHDSRSRRHSDNSSNRRCVTIQGNLRKDSYYRNDPKSAASPYDRSAAAAAAAYDRGPHRFGPRNGFDRRLDWVPPSRPSSGDHREWGREGYDSRDRREGFDRDRREWGRRDRDRRQGREDWHSSSDEYRSSSAVWDSSSSRFSSVQVPAAGEASTFASPVVSSVHQASLPPGSGDEQMNVDDPGAHVPMEIDTDLPEEQGCARDEAYEPGEVTTSKPSRDWVYIDDGGATQGPMELAALKMLASKGLIHDDHLVMRSGTNEWVTLEHARSPGSCSSAPMRQPDHLAAAAGAAGDDPAGAGSSPEQAEQFDLFFDIDERVGKILEQFSVGEGNELASVLSALDAQRQQHSADRGAGVHELSNPWKDSYELGFGIDSDLTSLDALPRIAPPEPAAPPPPPPPPPIEEDCRPAIENASPLKWKPGQWTSKGGDWKLIHPDGQNYVKVVLNGGSLLCERPHYGVDPRMQLQVSEKPKFELPQWALERNHKADPIAETPAATPRSKTAPAPKPAADRPGRTSTRPPESRPGTFLAKKVSDSRARALPLDRPSRILEKSSASRSQSRVSHSADIKSKCNHDLSRGDWFYKDGGGRERGPYSFSELQAMVAKELLVPGTSAYRKHDDLWVPLPPPEMDDGNFSVTEVTASGFDSGRRLRKVVATTIQQSIMGFTSGQLHEHVMKHYKNQVMSAILFEGLDARMKLIESNRRLSTCSTVALLSGEDSWLGYGRSLPSPSSSHDTSDEREDGEPEFRSNKRPLFRSNGSSQEQTSRKRRLVYSDDVESSDDELLPPPRRKQRRLVFSEVFDSSDEHLYEKGSNSSWETLGQLILMRICHHLKGDLKSISSVSASCRSWRAAVELFKPKVRCLDLSAIGVHCSDDVLSAIQDQKFGVGNLKQIVLKDCSALTPDALGKFLEAYPTIQDVDINGCDQFGELVQVFPHVNWVYDDSEVSDSATQGSDDSNRKMKSLNSIGTCSLSKDDDDADESEPMDIDPCYSNEQDLDLITQHKRVKVTATTDIKVLKDNGYLKGKRKTAVTKKVTKLRRSVKTVVVDEDIFADIDDYAGDAREWGARMTKAAMVPPVTRKYEVIDDYWIVIDKDLVERKMKVEVPDDYEEKLRASKLKQYSHLDIPEIKEYHPRRELGVEVMEQEVYGIDPYTHNLILDTMPKQPALTPQEKMQFMEETLLQNLNKEVMQFTGTGKAPIEFPLEPVIQRIVDDAKANSDPSLEQFAQGLLTNMRNRSKEKYLAYRKGLGVVCNRDGGFGDDDFIVEFLGEVYPAWRWYEKQDGCRYLQKKDKEPLPEFYNILLERPKGDAAGYDLVVVDAMHKANFASRICHSCRPNCEAKVTAVNGKYIIGVYALRTIQNGEELTFDYNSVTESKEEYNNSICLCGSQCCRGSYLNLANAGASQDVIKERHGLLDRHVLLLQACDGPVTRFELEEMRQAGLGSCLLDGLPDWLLKYTARLVEFMNLERQLLPEELMKSVKKRRKDDYSYEVGRADAENQAEGVYNQRLQNIAITLDKVRYVLGQLFTDPREAPPLLKKLDPKELVSRLWSGPNSVVNELLGSMMPHIAPERLAELKRQVQEHTPDERGDGSLRESLLWLRDTLRSLEPTLLSRHDAAADLIHMYAYTQCFFTCEEYGTFESPPIEISSLDLGKHINPPSCHKWKKTYNKEYVLGQLISWFKQSCADPGASLVQQRRGCLVLPDFSSCYSKGLQQDSRRAYGSRIREEMFPRMERWPQKQWPKSQFWEFKGNRGLFGSPMLDAVQRRGYADSEMMHWLKTRPVNFVGPYDD